MNLSDVRDGTRALIDANIFLYWLTQRSIECGLFLRRCADRSVQGYASVLSLTEVAHRLMMLEAKENGWAEGPNPVRSLELRPERVQTLRRYEDRLRDILALRLHLEDFQHVDLIESFSIRRRYGLLTNDSIFIAVAVRLGIRDVISADKGLERAAGYTVYQPSDLK
ncbi:MAG: type II toxin-antitoxin system VapC family toxin [Acidobacteriota bacterium]